MATSQASLSHLERTAHEPRDKTLHRVRISGIEQVDGKIRVVRLRPVEGEGEIKFLPGQWLDVHIPNIPKAGGFTITSPPSLLSSPTPYLELAISYSPSNPASSFFHVPPSSILDTELRVRIGGSFVWPPTCHAPGGVIKRVVFVAGGIGVNPLMAMLSHLSEMQEKDRRFDVKMLYSVRDPGLGRNGKGILFLDRLMRIFETWGNCDGLKLYLTPGKNGEEAGEAVMGGEDGEILYRRRRIRRADLESCLGEVRDRAGTVVYVCGVPEMTDELVGWAREAEGMDGRHVLCEKWW